MTKINDQGVAIDGLRLPKPKMEALLKKAEEEAGPPAHPARKLQGARAVVGIAQMGSEAAYSVPMREISDAGMAFLHRSMLHPKTPCTLHLVLPDGERIDVVGKVVSVRHIEGMIHDISVVFDTPLDLASIRAA